MGNSFDVTWTTKLVDTANRVIPSPLAASLLVLGWIPAGLGALTILSVGDTPSIMFITGTGLAVLMVVFGPYDVWYYERRLFPGFFEDVQDIIQSSDQHDMDKIADRYNHIFVHRKLLVVVPWMATVIAVFFTSSGYFATEGITPATPVAYWSYFLFFVWWGFYTGMGIHGGLVTVACIREISEQVEFRIEPLHPDNLGGLSTIGSFAIQTTVILSTGSLALPLSFQIAANSGYGGLVYVGVLSFSVVIALTFIYPTFKINRSVQKKRETILDDYRQRIRSLEREVTDIDEAEETRGFEESMTIQLEIQRVRREFREYRDVNLYPLSISIISRLVSSILLPLFFLLFEFVLQGVF